MRTSRRALPCGDDAVEVGDAVVAAVERKSLADLVTSTRKLAEEWTYRYLAAARAWAEEEAPARDRMGIAGQAGRAGASSRPEIERLASPP